MADPVAQIGRPAPVQDATADAEAVRARNGLRVLLVAFVTILLSFLVLLFFFAKLKSTPYALAASDVIAIFGIITSLVGTLVGTYFGISAANGAREASATQAMDASDVANRALDQVKTP
jgi:hypothetical protein